MSGEEIYVSGMIAHIAFALPTFLHSLSLHILSSAFPSMPNKSPFTREQNAFIDSFLDAFVVKVESSPTTGELTKWKQSTATQILESPLFTDLDLNKASRKQWYEQIVRKFTNYLNNMHLKKSCKASSQATAASPGSLLINFSSVLTGRQLFARERRESINKSTTDRLATTVHQNSAAMYQTVLKEKWDSLPATDHEAWDVRAAAEAGDVVQNQRDFVPGMHHALRDLCQNGRLGHAELFLLYAFRAPSDGDIVAGIINGHSICNRLNFGDDQEQLQQNFAGPWIDFVEEVIPRPVATKSAVSLIPRNDVGMSIFPCIDLGSATPASVRHLLREYFTECWAHVHGTGPDSLRIPWDDIFAQPASFYDVSLFSFPAAIQNPESMSNIDTITVSEFLLKYSSILADKPFRFFSKGQIARDGEIARKNLGVPSVNDATAIENTAGNEDQRLQTTAETRLVAPSSTTLHPSDTVAPPDSMEPCTPSAPDGTEHSHRMDHPHDEVLCDKRKRVNSVSKDGPDGKENDTVPKTKRRRLPPKATGTTSRRSSTRVGSKAIPNQAVSANLKGPKGRLHRGWVILDDDNNEVDMDAVVRILYCVSVYALFNLNGL
ncbi:hypothetical protein C8R45DRAFT_1111708 [Mycena sanguinolenta]|nr:hypothetical protein C8R45DRAFT_1111708 [Mycena sanguinolenta]